MTTLEGLSFSARLLFGGGMIIYVAKEIAPSHTKSVAVITCLTCLLSVGIFFGWERRAHSSFSNLELPADIYGFGAALGTFVVLLKM
jgi:hypothetical protein